MEIRTVSVQYPPEKLTQLVEDYRAWLRSRPDDAATRYMLGACLFQLGRSEEGRAEWDSLLALKDPFWTDGIQRSLKIVEPTA